MIAMDWSLLLPELLHTICTKLPEVNDAIRFRVVCKAWRSSFSFSYSSSFLPWILICDNQTENGNLQFYSPFSGKTYNIHVPQASGTTLIGPAKGYFLSHKYPDASLSLLNPFMANEISLPPIEEEIRHPLYILMIPKRNKDQTIILGKNSSDNSQKTLSLGISQPGYAQWITIKLGNITTEFGACAYYNGMCFISDPSNLCTRVFDAITGNIVSLIPDFKKKNEDKTLEYLVESGGKLLRIVINKYNSHTELSLDVYVLNVKKGYRWLEIKDIDDNILFLDGYYSFSLTSRELHGLRGNCIYFFSHKVAMNNEEERCLLHRYDLGNSNIETLPFPFMRCGEWIMPRMC